MDARDPGREPDALARETGREPDALAREPGREPDALARETGRDRECTEVGRNPCRDTARASSSIMLMDVHAAATTSSGTPGTMLSTLKNSVRKTCFTPSPLAADAAKNG